MQDAIVQGARTLHFGRIVEVAVKQAGHHRTGEPLDLLQRFRLRGECPPQIATKSLLQPAGGDGADTSEPVQKEAKGANVGRQRVHSVES